jgi:hypothetical protein
MWSAVTGAAKRRWILHSTPPQEFGMRHIMTGVVSALAVLGAGITSAAACGGYGCGPCPYATPCGYGVVYSGYGYDYIDVARLPAIAVPRWQAPPQYYYVDQGPTYTGPGLFAPLPTYQERAVRSRYDGRYDYGVSYDYRYRGGPYANAMHHYYAGAPAWHGPANVSYRPRAQSHRSGVTSRAHRHHAAHHHHTQHPRAKPPAARR